jgi:hypothetical protein
MMFLSLKNSACLFSWLTLSSLILFLTSSCRHRKLYIHQLFDFFQPPLTKLTCSAEWFQSHRIFTCSHLFTSDVSMTSSYRRFVKGTWTQVFSFHKHSLSPFIVYTLEAEAASLTETSVTKIRQNILSQKNWVFNLVTLTTSFSCLSLFSSVLSIFLWIFKREFRLFILNEFDQFL